MSHYGDGPNANDWRHVRAEGERETLDSVAEHNAMLAQVAGIAHTSPARRVLRRLRRVVSGGEPPAPPGPQSSDEDVWNRELTRRHEYEQDRSDE